MPNYLHPIQSKFSKAKKELENAIEVIEENAEDAMNPLQQLNVTDGMVEVFKDKPVVLIQNMNINIVQIINPIQNALRLLDKIDVSLYRESMLRTAGKKRTRKEDKEG